MIPRPLYRWKSLWLGLLVVMFLGWAWWDSTRWKSSFRYQQSSLTHAGSGICLADLGRTTNVSPWWGRRRIDGSSGDSIWQEARIDRPEILRVTGDRQQFFDYYPFDRRMGESEPRNAAARHFNEAIVFAKAGAWGIYLPHWLFMLVFLVPWSGLLVWRWRRVRRLTSVGP